MKNILSRKRKRLPANAAQTYRDLVMPVNADRIMQLATNHAAEIINGRDINVTYSRDAEAIATDIAEHSRHLREQLKAELAMIRLRDRLAVEALNEMLVEGSFALNIAEGGLGEVKEATRE